MLHTTVLVAHVAAGAAGLVLGPVAMRAAKRPGVHTRTGEIYHWLVLAVCVSALGLAAFDPAHLWWLALIAVGSYGFAFMGYTAAKRRGPGWLIRHVSGQGGSYIALVTALLTVNVGVGTAWVWIVPSVVGTASIVSVNAQIAAGRRPATWRGQPNRLRAAWTSSKPPARASG